MRKRDFLIIALVLVAACALLILSGQTFSREATGRVNVYVDGDLYATGYLGMTTPIIVRQGEEENVIAFTKDGFHMESSTCRNQQCVHQGEVTLGNYHNRALGTRIICLPNRVTVELVLSDGSQPDDLPDV